MAGFRDMVSEYQDDLRLHSIIHNSSLILAFLFSYNQNTRKNIRCNILRTFACYTICKKQRE